MLDQLMQFKASKAFKRNLKRAAQFERRTVSDYLRVKTEDAVKQTLAAASPTPLNNPIQGPSASAPAAPVGAPVLSSSVALDDAGTPPAEAAQ